MLHPDQVSFVLPNETISRLNLPYTPFHWQQSEAFPEYGGFSIQEPWAGYKDKKWYAKDREPYDRIRKLLKPYHDQWIQADCIAALIPDAGGHNFQMAVNGVMLSASLYESQRLQKLMRQRMMPLLVTTCNARITGGGALLDGRTRGYSIGFDVAALRELDAIKRQRNSEKAVLFNVFVFPIIADLAKKSSSRFSAIAVILFWATWSRCAVTAITTNWIYPPRSSIPRMNSTDSNLFWSNSRTYFLSPLIAEGGKQIERDTYCPLESMLPLHMKS